MHAISSTTKNINGSAGQLLANDKQDRRNMISPIRESLIQNAGHFILGQKNNASNSNVGVGSSNLANNDILN